MTINPNPEFLSAEEEARGYRAVARIALYWGPIELQVETVIVCLRNLQGETDVSFPVSFSRKVVEMKDRFKRERCFYHLRDQIVPLVGRSKELHIIRNHIVHSYFQVQNLDGKLMFGRSDQKRGVSYTEARYSSEEIEATTNEMINIHDALEAPVLELFRSWPGEFRRRNIERISRTFGSADQ